MGKTESVWKFGVPVQGRNEIPMPKGAHVISCAVQHQSPVLWARVDPTAALVRRVVHLITTGQEGEISGEFVGTLLLNNGYFVAHVFVEPEAVEREAQA